MKAAHPILNGILGNWDLNVIQTLETGIPFSFTFAGASSVFLPMGLRPNMAPGKTYDDIRIPWNRKGPNRHAIALAAPWADINAFAYPDSFTAGNSGRNILNSPGMMWHQITVSKRFPIRERLAASVRWDMSNPFKYYFFNAPNATVDFRNPQNFGKIPGHTGGFSPLGGKTYHQLMFKIEW